MALLVEDGTGVVGAESYVTVAAFQSWATKRGYLLPAVEADVEALLRKGVDFLERKRYVGEIEFTDQGLSFPRIVVDSSGIAVSSGVPSRVQMAQMLLAFEAMSGPLTTTARPNKYAATKIDAIYLKYNDAAESAGDLYFQAVDDLLQDYLAYGGAVIRTVRA